MACILIKKSLNIDIDSLFINIKLLQNGYTNRHLLKHDFDNKSDMSVLFTTSVDRKQ